MDLAQLYRRRALSERAMATRHVPGSRIGSPFDSPEPRPGPVTSDVNIVNYRAGRVRRRTARVVAPEAPADNLTYTFVCGPLKAKFGRLCRYVKTFYNI